MSKSVTRMASGIFLMLSLGIMLNLVLGVQPVESQLKTIVVPDDYPTIQQAINAANQGDTIQVKRGVYSEEVVVNKTVTLVGASLQDTVLDGVPAHVDLLLNITMNNVVIKGFTIQGADTGIFCQAANITIQNNTLTSNHYGISLWSLCSYNIISGNNITGICDLRLDSSSYNTLSGNHLAGVDIVFSNSHNNTFFNNNFVGGQISLNSLSVNNTWNNPYPSGGNYWSNYVGVDEKKGLNQDQLGSDGIGDTSYIIDLQNRDWYPLKTPVDLPDFVIPEFPFTALLLSFMMLALVAAIFAKKKSMLQARSIY